MGSITKMLKDISGAKEDETEQKERLEMILSLAKAKIKGFKSDLNMMFMNPAEIDRIQIPGNRSIRFIEQYHVAVSEGFSDTVHDHMSAAIDAFFSLGDKGGNTKKSIKTGVQSLISTALDGFIGSTEVGESEEHIYVVIPENNAFVRVDIACWKYHFNQHKIINQSDTAVAYLLCKSVVNHDELSIDELIYLATDALSQRQEMHHITYNRAKIAAEITAYFGDSVLSGATKPNFDADRNTDADQKKFNKLFYGEDVKDADLKLATKINSSIEKYKVLASGETPDILETFHEFHAADGFVDFVQVEGKWQPKFILPHALDINSASTSTPSSISVVEAYIEELIRVWNKLTDERKVLQ